MSLLHVGIQIRAIATVVVILVSSVAHSGEWIRGTGENLEIRIRGRFVLPEGIEPDTVDFQVTATDINQRQFECENLVAFPDVEVWLPANRERVFSFQVSARTKDGAFQYFENIPAVDLRKTALRENKWTLNPSERDFTVSVKHDDQRVKDAWVRATFDSTNFIDAKTDDSGVAHFRVSPRWQLHELAAWTESKMIGGYQFFRGPYRDPKAESFFIELTPCHEEKMVFVDEDWNGIPDTRFQFHIATSAPHYNYIGFNPHFTVQTDKNGGGVLGWIPNWELMHIYVEATDHHWRIIDDKGIAVEEGRQYRVRKEAEVPRTRCHGRVQGMSGAISGLLVGIHSFQSGIKDHGDYLHCFTDGEGRFEFDGISGVVYSAYTGDTDWCAEIIDFKVPGDEDDEPPTVELNLEKGLEIDLWVVDSDQMPVGDFYVGLLREHDVKWIEGGQLRTGISHQQRSFKTDAAGRVKARVLAGPNEAYIYTTYFQGAKKFQGGEVEQIKFELPVPPKTTNP